MHTEDIFIYIFWIYEYIGICVSMNRLKRTPEKQTYINVTAFAYEQ